MMSMVAMARPAPLTMQPIEPSSLMYDEVVLGRLDLHRVLLGLVAQRSDVGMAEQRVAVEVHFRIEADAGLPSLVTMSGLISSRLRSLSRNSL